MKIKSEMKLIYNVSHLGKYIWLIENVNRTV